MIIGESTRMMAQDLGSTETTQRTLTVTYRLNIWAMSLQVNQLTQVCTPSIPLAADIDG